MVTEQLADLLGSSSPVRHRARVPKLSGICPDPREGMKGFTLACPSTKKAGATVETKKK